MKAINRILFVLLILFIPFTSLLAAMNLVYRVPDLYKYEFNRSEVTGEISLNVSGEELAGFFSDYMLGKMNDFQLTAEYQGREQPVFGAGEGSVMARFRLTLNITFVALCLMLVVILFACWFLLRQRRKEAVRYAYRGGMILYAVLAAAFTALPAVSALRSAFLDAVLPYQFAEEDLLPLMLTGHFAVFSAVAILVISALLIGIGFSIIRKLARPNRMFWRSS